MEKQKSGLIFCGYLNKNIRKTGVRAGTLHLSRTHKQPNRIYHILGKSPTLLSAGETSGGYFIYDGKNVYKLSLEDCFNLQGFKNYKKIGSKSSLYKMIGNAVPINMIEAVTKEIKNQLF